MMRTLRHSMVTAVAIILAATTLAVGPGPADATGSMPTYRVDAVVPDAFATALNEAGDFVGWQYGGGGPRAFVYAAGALTLLPTAADRPLSVARDINDTGAVVGYAYKTTIDEPGNAMRWTLGASGWTVQDLGVLTGELVSEATGLNDAGQVVGHANARTFLGEKGFLYSNANGMTDVLASESFVPQDINESGVVVGNGYSTAKRVNTVTGAVTNLTVASEYEQSYAYALNDAGQVAGTIVSLFGRGQVVARYSDGAGWQNLGGIGGGSCSGCVNNVGWGINSAGTVVGTGWPRTGVSPPYERGVIYLDSQGSLLYVDDLLEAGSEWTVYAASDINDAGQIAGYARNHVNSTWAAVRLSPVGALPVPAAPTGLSATPYAARTVQEQNRIELRWTDASNNETGFEVQRRRVDASGAPFEAYGLLATVSANVSSHNDLALTLGARYEYRVRATGTAGPSAWSNTAIAVAPSTAPETIAPVVAIVSPASGATVSRNVTVVVSATDNVGVTRVELVVGSKVITCSAAVLPRYSCRWDTRKFSDGGWTLYARAWDKVGNLGQHAITVTVKNRR